MREDGTSCLEAQAASPRSKKNVSVASCIEDLPLGRTHFEIMLCGFLTWFLLGAIYESTPLAFFAIGQEWALTPQRVGKMASALVAGNFLSVVATGWLADRYGRATIAKAALLGISLCGPLLQMSTTFAQALGVRLTLGAMTGCLLVVMPMLVVELLPWRYRGAAAALWGCGWPVGALFALGVATLMPTLGWRSFYALTVAPALLLYIVAFVGFLPESPRYLYLAGRRQEGHAVLQAMYAKQKLTFPWPHHRIETIAGFPFANASASTRFVWPRSAIKTTLWVFLAMFALNSAALSVKIWLPAVIAARRAKDQVLYDQMVNLRVSVVGSAYMNETELDLHNLGMHLASRQNLDTAPGPLLPPTERILWLLAQAYSVEFIGIVCLGFASLRLGRRPLVYLSLILAFLSTTVAVALADGGHLSACVALVGVQLLAHATAYNFMTVFITEHYPTSRRAGATSILVCGALTSQVLLPALGGVIALHASLLLAVVAFCVSYLLGFVAVLWLPLQSEVPQPLRDVDECKPSASPCNGPAIYGAVGTLRARPMLPA